jgi:hypothetical protein
MATHSPPDLQSGLVVDMAGIYAAEVAVVLPV